MRHYLEYYSPDGYSSVRFDPYAVEGPYFLMLGPEGFTNLNQSSQTRKGVRQVGSTLVDVSIDERVISLQVAVLADNAKDYWNRRKKLIDTLVVNPTTGSKDIRPGTLRLIRGDGLPSFEIPVVPNGPIEGGRPDVNSVVLDIEFEAASAYWRETKSLSAKMNVEEGGFTFELEHEWESVAYNSEVTINNPGSVPCPFIADIYGEFTNARLLNLLTGEVIHFNTNLPAGDFVRINTGYGSKSAVIHRANGSEENGMKYMNLTSTVFWQIQRGSQMISLEADLNVGAYADISWRPLHGGI